MLPLPLAAQAVDATLQPTVVTARRDEQRLDDALPHTTLIRREEIERSQARDLVDLLARQAGVEMAQTGGPGAQASLFVRGTGSAQVLVLLDGVPVNNALGGAALGGINLDTIERIEIVRGNLSSLYGSEAIGGVVQLFSRAPGAPGGSAAVELGSHAQRSAAATLRARLGDAQLAVSAGARHVGGVSALDPAAVRPTAFMPAATTNPDRDGVDQRSASVRLGVPIAPGADFEGSFTHTDNRLRYDSVRETAAADERERSAIDAWHARWRVPLTDRLRATLATGEGRQRARTDVTGIPFEEHGSFGARNRQLGLELQWQATHVALRGGWESLGQRAGSTNFDPAFSGQRVDFERTLHALWAGLDAATADGRHQVQLNLRRDRIAGTGSATTGLVSYGVRLGAGLKATAQVSTAFRAPSFNDLYYPGFGNPSLRPEKARSAELGLRWQRGELRASLAVYRTLMRDLIAYDPAAFRPDNIAAARLDGVELAAGGRLGAWTLAGNLSLGRAIDTQTRLRLLRRAPSTLNLEASWQGGPWRLGGGLSRLATRPDVDNNTFARIQTPSYTRARLLAECALSSAWNLHGRVENLFDDRGRLVDGYNTLGRTVVLGVDARW